MGCKNNFYGATSKAMFQMHMDTIKLNEKEENSQSPCNGKYVITCDICSYKCGEETIFKTHFTSHLEKKLAYKEPISCKKCDFKFKGESLRYIIEHLKAHLICKICGQMFSGNNGKRSAFRHLKVP